MYSSAFADEQDSLIKKHRLNLDFGFSSSKDLSFSKTYNDDRRIYTPTIGLTYSINISGINWFVTGLSYYQVGDVYNYYTGINNNRTDVKIYLNTIKIPLLYSIQFRGKYRTNFFMSAGPSLDFVIGQSVISPNETLHDPNGFRNNVIQGKVEKYMFMLLNVSGGLTFENKKGQRNYLEVVYYGTMDDLFKASPYGDGTSSYSSIVLKFGIVLFQK